MRKLLYLGISTTLAGTIAFCFALIHHIQNITTSSSDLLISAVLICLGSIVWSKNKYQKVK